MKKARVTYHREPEGWSALSADVPGYSAFGETLGEVRGLVREGLAFFLDLEWDQLLIEEEGIVFYGETVGKAMGTVVFRTTSTQVMIQPIGSANVTDFRNPRPFPRVSRLATS